MGRERSTLSIQMQALERSDAPMVRQPASFLPGCPGGNPGSTSLGRRGMSPPAASWSCFPQVKRVRGRAVPPGQFASGSLANRTSGWQVQAIPRGRRQSGSCHTCTSWMVPGRTMCGCRQASSATLGAWRPYRGCERGHWSGTGFGVASVSWFVLLSDRQPFGQNRPRERDFPGRAVPRLQARLPRWQCGLEGRSSLSGSWRRAFFHGEPDLRTQDRRVAE